MRQQGGDDEYFSVGHAIAPSQAPVHVGTLLALAGGQICIVLISPVSVICKGWSAQLEEVGEKWPPS